MIKLKKFAKELESKQLSDSTIYSYVASMRLYSNKFKNINDLNIKAYKAYLIENNKPQTVNLRLRAINAYCETFNLPNRVKFIKVQRKTYLENVISNSDYIYLYKHLKKDNNLQYYFIIRLLAATGARISELVQFKVEHLKVGYVDIYSKGNRSRRIYIPRRLRNEGLLYFTQDSGLLFDINTTSIRNQIKEFAYRYNIPKEVMHPHSFRHLFAKNFISKYNDLALLADLMGHASIETTRIYLQRTSAEQQAIIDKIVVW